MKQKKLRWQRESAEPRFKQSNLSAVNMSQNQSLASMYLERITVNLINIQSTLKHVECVHDCGPDSKELMAALQRDIGGAINRSSALSDAIIKFQKTRSTGINRFNADNTSTEP